MTMLFHNLSNSITASLNNSGYETISKRHRFVQKIMFVMYSYPIYVTQINTYVSESPTEVYLVQ